MKVGITLKIASSPFTNGLGQNAFFLHDTLSQIEEVTGLYLVDVSSNINIEEFSSNPYYKGYNIDTLANINQELDVLITLGTMPASTDLEIFKDRKGTRIIGFKGGNNLILSTEDLLFERKWGQRGDEKIEKSIAYPSDRLLFDQIWMVPQQEYHNKDYYEISFGAKAISTPFLWSPYFLEERINLIKKEDPNSPILFESREFDRWRAASMEPNTSILKNMMPIIHSMEWANRLRPDLFKQFNITNSSEFRDHPILIEIVKSITIQQEKKLGFDPRWNTVDLLRKYAEMVVSHQWGNPLNYAYLDVVYLGYPLIHNAHLCQDIGYYYPDFELKEAGELMIYAAENHKKDIDYMERHREILKRYHPHNEKVVDQYRNLLLGLYDSSHKVEGQYNWKTNLIE